MDIQGIFIQQMFPFGAFGPRQWSLSEMQRLFGWLKGLGITDLAFGIPPLFRREDDPHTILEHGALYHSGLRELPPFDPGFAYCPTDRYLGTPAGLKNAEFFRDQARLARDLGLRPWQMVNFTLGSPEFLEKHPELAAVHGSEVFLEGAGFCPSRPEALKHLLEFHAGQIQFFDAMEAFLLFPRDPGGCSCKLCTPQTEMMVRTSRQFHAMIRSLRPNAPIAFLSWHIKEKEVPELAEGLPKDLDIFEAPRIHALDAPMEEFINRVKAWQAKGRQVHGWLETQENPTALLPSVYPRRIDSAIRTMKQLKIKNLWQTSVQNPYLFPLHFWITPKLWENRDLGELLKEFLAGSYGSESIEPGLRYFDIMEQAWEKVQNEEHYKAGFLGLFVITFPFRMLPEQLIHSGVPSAIRGDLDQATILAKEALTAAERFADHIREFHALDANILAASAEVFYYRVKMRQAKIPVLDALHTGDAGSAVQAWSSVEEACESMVAAAKNAPNTDVLANHWRRLALLPGRLKALAQHLPELADRKIFRPIKQPLYIGQLYTGKKGN